ncbi:MAG: MFS transporter [Bacillaceae bacterium]|nr:MFS transporter [Bacillaceae bacterium]
MNKRAVFGWTMYDWANSAFVTVIMAAVMPIFYRDVAAETLPSSTATAYWGYTQSIAMLIIAVLAPVLGAVSDYSRSKKKFLMFFAYMGALSSILLFFVGQGDYLLASLLVILGTIGFSAGNVFYDGFLPEIAGPDRIDQVSARGFALGYLGGGILLLIDLMMIMKPHLFGIPDTETATRIAFVTVGLWWFVFSIPMFRNVPENRSQAGEPLPSRWSYLQISFSRIYSTLKHMKHYRELAKFLIAYFLFNDGISTIIKMATIYGREIGIGTTDLITALLITQFVGFPFAFLFGTLAGRIGAKNGLYLALSVYILITILGYFMTSALHFYLLAIAVGMVQGGSQALSRSIYGIMIPVNRTSEFYGFYGISSKFSAILGPLLFGVIAQWTDSSRSAILSLILFFILGMIMLTRVDIQKGRREAQTVS